MSFWRRRKMGRVEFDVNANGSETDAGVTDVDFTVRDPNVVTSLTNIASVSRAMLAAQPDEVYHYPVIDLDFECHLEPSSTPGHYHLYLDRVLTQAEYFKLLDVMAEVGLVEPGYVDASKKRGFTTARLPWVSKGSDPMDDGVRFVKWVRRTLNLDD